MFNEKATSLDLEASRHPATRTTPTTAPHASPRLATSQHISPHLATSRHISPRLQATSVKLFVKRVFISESFEEQLLPRSLPFLNPNLPN